MKASGKRSRKKQEGSKKNEMKQMCDRQHVIELNSTFSRDVIAFYIILSLVMLFNDMNNYYFLLHRFRLLLFPKI